MATPSPTTSPANTSSLTLSEDDLEELLDTAHDFASQDPDTAAAASLRQLIAAVEAGDVDATTDLADRFADRLRFGTAGLRGKVEAGTNRMNRVVVMQAAWGLGRYLLEAGMGVPASQGVVVGFDSRRLSRQFAEDTAAVLAAMEIPCYLFPNVVPTPVCAYAVVQLNAAAGVMVTASHNPPADNGYKVYQSTGGQIIAPHDAGIASWMDQAPRVTSIERKRPFDAAKAGLRHAVPDVVIEGYLDGITKGCLHPEATVAHPQRVVYTAMHGVGHAYVEQALRRAGVHGVAVVPSQTEPDGAFPTVAFPNPEEPGAMDLALALAEEVNADVVLANDPDADRLAVGVPLPSGGYRMLTGNEVGALLGHDALAFADVGAATKLAVTTIVSSTLLGRIAKDLGHAYAETLTGFKWLADAGITRLPRGERFVFGYEEALGYSVSDMVRDKDGVSAVVRLVELAAWLQGQERTLLEELDRLALAHGLSVGAQWSVRLPGQTGRAQIDAVLQTLRAEPLTALAGVDVVERHDLSSGEAWAAEGAPRALDLPAADVLLCYDAEGTRLVVRPSGTEPKIKFYLESVGRPRTQADIAPVRAEREARLAAIRSDIMARLGL